MTKDNTKTKNRREFLKDFALVPVIGLYLYSLKRKLYFEAAQSENIIEKFNLSTEYDFPDHPIPKDAPVRIGIIGMGTRGKQLARALGFVENEWVSNNMVNGKPNERLSGFLRQKDLNVQITGICDVFDIHANEGIDISANQLNSKSKVVRLKKATRFKHYQEMLESDQIDAVMIATPDHWHSKMAIEAAKAGKHVYSEKCMTRTADEAVHMFDVINKSDIVFQLGHQNRQQESFYMAREIINKNMLGNINLVQVNTNRNTPWGAWIRTIHPKGNKQTIDWNQFLGDRPYHSFSADRFFNWQKWFDYGTGVSGQLFSHEYDAMNQILNLGIPKSVIASGGIYHFNDNRDIPDVFNATYEYPEKKLSLTYSATLANASDRENKIYGSDGEMEVGKGLIIHPDRNSNLYQNEIERGSIDPSEPLLVFDPKSDQIDAVTSATAKYYEKGGFGSTYRNGQLMDATYLHVKNWLDCIRHGGTPMCDINSGFEEAITCHMATTSYLEKRRVEWDSGNRKIV